MEVFLHWEVQIVRKKFFLRDLTLPSPSGGQVLAPPLGGAGTALAVTEGVSLFRTKLPPTSLALSHLPQRGRQDLAPPLGELARP